jgi:hypothetical protein
MVRLAMRPGGTRAIAAAACHLGMASAGAQAGAISCDEMLERQSGQELSDHPVPRKLSAVENE